MKNARPLVVIPTYNERENLKVLLPQVFAVLKRGNVLVVDDSSPDRTARTALQMSRRYHGRVHVISRPRKLGLGSAYVEGFRYALGNSKFDPVLQMDADGSHDPRAIPLILETLKRADLAVGSRYLKGLRVINWPWMRLFLSIAANWYARLVTGVPVSDLTGGFNGMRRKILEQIGPERLKSSGYAFQIELKHQCHRLGARIVEVPVIFAGRMEGESKLSRSVVFEAILAVWRMRLSKGR